MRIFVLFSLLLLCLRAETPVLHPLSVFPVMGGGEGLAETVAWDRETLSLFVSNARGSVSVIDLSNPATPKPRFNIQAEGSVNSVAISSGLVAMAVAASPKTDAGHVAFFDKRGVAQGKLPVGSLPDMLTFTPDGKSLLVANEGEASGDTNPLGQISIIRLADVVSSSVVQTVSFEALEPQRDALRQRGLRVFPDIPIAADLEPEYIAITPDSAQAWVCLQEANALAVLDVATGELQALHPLGTKDHSLPGQGLDASDKDDEIEIASWPVRGMYMPDAIAIAEINGARYIFSANEGDTREEDKRVSKVKLDAAAFPSAKKLQDSEELGRLKISSIDGDTDGDGDMDVLYSYGARSFSIWNMQGKLVYDSGDLIARTVAKQSPELFNADNQKDGVDDRSDDKGAEPEAVAVGKIGNRSLAFVGLERSGGVMMFDVSTPTEPSLLQYVNDREHQRGPEDIEFIPAAESPNGFPLIVVANEISGTIGVYEIR